MARVQGDARATAQLLPLVYEELRRLAAGKMAEEAPGQTIQATALVHEAYIRLVDVAQAQHWESRGHFVAAAAEAMQRILIESARRKMRLKCGGDLEREEIELIQPAVEADPHELLGLDEALTELAAGANCLGASAIFPARRIRRRK